MPAARRLILIRHSLSAIDPELPPARWRLTDEGRARAIAFAARVDPGSADRVFASPEPKALETAQALGTAWRLPVEAVPGLREHERPDAGLLPPERFPDRVRELFARPSEIVFGAETADAARERFTSAVTALGAHGTGDLIAVSHGTVMALFVSRHTGADPFAFWRRQEMPFAVTFTLPGLRLDRITFLQREERAV